VEQEGNRMQGKRITVTIRDVAPCKGCAERFIGCHGRCPKDERGEHGYNAFKTEIGRVNAARIEYENKKMRCSK
jgi:hypothetical protein